MKIGGVNEGHTSSSADFLFCAFILFAIVFAGKMKKGGWTRPANPALLRVSQKLAQYDALETFSKR
ncbi:MAG: hypothetical protein C0469_15710 [Cyanobacteria bacterium DS2.3.42]|nr:hypothetical protein [Cyanobacteria bacterium DS2.3.42]